MIRTRISCGTRIGSCGGSPTGRNRLSAESMAGWRGAHENLGSAESFLFMQPAGLSRGRAESGHKESMEKLWSPSSTGESPNPCQPAGPLKSL
jgi:hypothetical protein